MAKMKTAMAAVLVMKKEGVPKQAILVCVLVHLALKEDFQAVDIDPTQIGPVFAADYGIASDAKAALELAVGAQFKLPYIHIVVNNSYLGLISQSQRGFSMDEYKVSAVIEIILARVTNISMGTEIYNINEFEKLAKDRTDVPHPKAVSMLD